MTISKKKANLLFGLVLFLCLIPVFTPVLALLTGLIFSLIGIRNETFASYNALALKASIVLMGFGMNLDQVLHASKNGFEITAISVVLTLLVGMLIARFLKIDYKIGLLISSGTAICGGSAIAAVAPVIDAKDYQISFALMVVFILNSVALVLFPFIGHYFHMSQNMFGYWAAIAIHDTSSVVGAGSIYGEKALEIATTVKLTRALWIIPLTISLAVFNKEKQSGKIQIPWFIGLFVIAILFSHFFPQMHSTFEHLNWLGKRGMVIALFLIGSNIPFNKIKEVGFKGFFMGILLWALISVSAMIIITSNLVQWR